MGEPTRLLRADLSHEEAAVRRAGRPLAPETNCGRSRGATRRRRGDGRGLRALRKRHRLSLRHNDNIREGVLSVIDLHLSVVSFEMNRVMRVLAVISALGMMPAIVGGLLGMNLVDAPWVITLPQI